REPKLGEAVAVRRVFGEINRDTLVDEATMEHLILSCGLKLRYVPLAIVRNHGPETLRDYIDQRTRVYAGHLALATTAGYRVSSMKKYASLLSAWRLWRRGESASSILIALSLEAVARGQALASQLRVRPAHGGIWHPITSSKRVLHIGQVLRAHHDDIYRLELRFAHAPSATRPGFARAASARIKSLVRS